jgi:CRP-like cAMP-binding protein
MPNVLTQKLASFGPLSATERQVLQDLIRDIQTVPARQDLLREGERPDAVHVILNGFACRYTILPDGARQIIAFLVPGDFCDSHVFVLGKMDHDVGTLSECQTAAISAAALIEVSEKHPGITRALWWSTLVDEAVLRAWVVNIGRRTAKAAVAHLFSELLIRLRLVGFASRTGFELPITQHDIADSLGLSNVHVNRVLKSLRKDGLIAVNGDSVVIVDPERLEKYSSFDEAYLHLGAASLPNGEPVSSGGGPPQR